MQRMIIEEDIKPMSEVRAGMAPFLKQIYDTKRPLIITQHGKGVAVMLDVGEYERMQKKLELLEDIHTSMAQLNRGEGVSHEQAKINVLKELVRRLISFVLNFGNLTAPQMVGLMKSQYSNFK